MSNLPEIQGSGTSYYAGMDAAGYAQRINTPAGNRGYYERFHLPVIDHAFGNRADRSIKLIDIACGPAFELDFVAEDERVDMVATDISQNILLEVNKRLGTRVETIAADASDIPSMPEFAEHSMDAGIIVNGMIYVPDKMLAAMAWVLKPGALCAANFRIYGNPHNDAFYSYYNECGGVVSHRELAVTTDYGSQTFEMAILDYTDCMDNAGKPDSAIRALGQQAYFMSTQAVKGLIELTGLTPRRHETFNFASPVNPNNQVDVFTMQA